MYAELNNDGIQCKENWSTYLLMDHKLIVHTLVLFNGAEINEEQKDPDGVPVLRFHFDRIIRTRKMTDAEYEQYFKEFGHCYSIKVDMVYAPEKDVPAEEKESPKKTGRK